MEDKLPNRHVRQKLYCHHKVGGHPGGRKLPPPFRRLVCRANVVRCQESEAGGREAMCVRPETFTWNDMFVRLPTVAYGCVRHLQSSRYCRALGQTLVPGTFFVHWYARARCLVHQGISRASMHFLR